METPLSRGAFAGVMSSFPERNILPSSARITANDMRRNSIPRILEHIRSARITDDAKYIFEVPFRNVIMGKLSSDAIEIDSECPSSSQDVRNSRDAFESERIMTQTRELQIYLDAIQDILKALEDGLISRKLFDAFVASNMITDSRSKLYVLRLLLQRLPADDYITLRDLMCFLHELVTKGNLGPTEVKWLSSKFSHAMMRKGSFSDICLHERTSSSMTMETLLMEFNHLFIGTTIDVLQKESLHVRPSATRQLHSKYLFGSHCDEGLKTLKAESPKKKIHEPLNSMRKISLNTHDRQRGDDGSNGNESLVDAKFMRCVDLTLKSCSVSSSSAPFDCDGAEEGNIIEREHSISSQQYARSSLLSPSGSRKSTAKAPPPPPLAGPAPINLGSGPPPKSMGPPQIRDENGRDTGKIPRPPILPPPPMRSTEGHVPLLPVTVAKAQSRNSPPPPPPMLLSPLLGTDRKIKLKQLHWEKLRGADKEGTVWRTSSGEEVEVDMTMLEALFKVPELPSEALKMDVKSKRKTLSVIDHTRAHNISIQLGVFGRMSFSNIRSALLGDPTEVLSEEQLMALSRTLPSSAESKLIQEYVGSGKDVSLLERVDLYFLELVQVPQVRFRVRCSIFKMHFEENIAFIRRDLRTLRRACCDLKESKALRNLLKSILEVGNHLNGGTFRGQAFGFKLDTLLRLMDVKAVDNSKLSLLHFIIQELLKSGHQSIIKLPEEISSCREASNVKPGDLHKAIDLLNNEMKLVQIELERDSRDDIEYRKVDKNDTFIYKFSLFMRSISSDVQAVNEEINVGIPAILRDITEYFGDSFVNVTQSMDVFNILRDFLGFFDRALEESLKSGAIMLGSAGAAGVDENNLDDKTGASIQENTPKSCNSPPQKTEKLTVHIERGSIPPPPAPPPPLKM